MKRKNRNLGPAGMKSGRFFKLSAGDFIKLPPESEIFTLPDRLAVSYDPSSLSFVEEKNRFAIAAFLPPGYTVTYNSAYKEVGRPKCLPLFSYAACAFHQEKIYTAAIRVDRSLRHDSRFMDLGSVKTNAINLKKLFPKNRLIKHLERCALCYGCPNARNFFLNRYEAPLPVSPSCNAGCAGCISYQKKNNKIPPAQPRISFIPTPEEIAEIALFHIRTVRNPIVSFGQGCEGEPLLCAGIIEKSIKRIRARTTKGVINMNTNGSLPVAIGRLFDAGLNSIRVSLNSVREKYYNRYYKPRGYIFRDVVNSISIAKRKHGFVSINYLTMPGFSDAKDEFAAFKKFLEKSRIDMVQWRNLNYDPLGYFKELKVNADIKDMIGIKEEMDILKKKFPLLRMGYFNPYEITDNRRI